MKHQPFENWLLEQEALPQAERRELELHLETCEQCSTLAAAARAVDRELHAAGMLSPAPGFSMRWRSRLAEERRRSQQVQTTAIVLALILGLSVLGILVAYHLITGLQWSGMDIVGWLNSVKAAVSQIKLVFGIWRVSLESMLSAVPWVYRIGLPITLAVLSAFWLSSIYQLGYLPKRRRF